MVEMNLDLQKDFPNLNEGDKGRFETMGTFVQCLRTIMECAEEMEKKKERSEQFTSGMRRVVLAQFEVTLPLMISEIRDSDFRERLQNTFLYSMKKASLNQNPEGYTNN